RSRTESPRRPARVWRARKARDGSGRAPGDRDSDAEDLQRQELEAARPVADLPAERCDLGAQAIGGCEVALGAGMLTLLGQLASLLRGLRGRGEQALQPQHAEHFPQMLIAVS